MVNIMVNKYINILIIEILYILKYTTILYIYIYCIVNQTIVHPTHVSITSDAIRRHGSLEPYRRRHLKMMYRQLYYSTF